MNAVINKSHNLKNHDPVLAQCTLTQIGEIQKIPEDVQTNLKEKDVKVDHKIIRNILRSTPTNYAAKSIVNLSPRIQ